jgi:hypothetical protein
MVTKGSDGAIVWTDDDRIEHVAPEFQGAKAQLQGGKIIYLDTQGKIEAELKPNLAIEGTQTGVLEIRPDVASPLIKMANTGRSLAIPLFVDITPIDNGQMVSISFSNDGPLAITSRMVLSVPQSVEIVEFDPFNTGINLSTLGSIVTYNIFDPSRTAAAQDRSMLGVPLLNALNAYGYGHEAGKLTHIPKDGGNGTVYLTTSQVVGTELATVSVGAISVSCTSGDLKIVRPLTRADLLMYQGVLVGVAGLSS